MKLRKETLYFLESMQEIKASEANAQMLTQAVLKEAFEPTKKLK